jgi:hypothetical protein
MKIVILPQAILFKTASKVTVSSRKIVKVHLFVKHKTRKLVAFLENFYTRLAHRYSPESY